MDGESHSYPRVLWRRVIRFGETGTGSCSAVLTPAHVISLQRGREHVRGTTGVSLAAWMLNLVVREWPHRSAVGETRASGTTALELLKTRHTLRTATAKPCATMGLDYLWA